MFLWEDKKQGDFSSVMSHLRSDKNNKHHASQMPNYCQFSCFPRLWARLGEAALAPQLSQILEMWPPQCKHSESESVALITSNKKQIKTHLMFFLCIMCGEDRGTNGLFVKNVKIEVSIGRSGEMKSSWEKTLDKKLVTLMHGVKISLHVNFFFIHHSDKQAQFSTISTREYKNSDNSETSEMELVWKRLIISIWWIYILQHWHREYIMETWAIISFYIFFLIFQT